MGFESADASVQGYRGSCQLVREDAHLALPGASLGRPPMVQGLPPSLLHLPFGFSSQLKNKPIQDQRGSPVVKALVLRTVHGSVTCIAPSPQHCWGWHSCHADKYIGGAATLPRTQWGFSSMNPVASSDRGATLRPGPPFPVHLGQPSHPTCD